MSRTTVAVITVACVLLFVTKQLAAEDKRIAMVVDSAGVTTEVSDLRFSSDLTRGFLSAYSGVVVTVGLIQVAIDVADIRSIKGNGKKLEIVLLRLGREATIVGELVQGNFTGKSDFGDVEIPISKVKELTYQIPPSEKSADEKKQLAERLSRSKAVLTLADETELSVSDLHRHDSYTVRSEGGIIFIGGSTRYKYYTDVRFKRGETLSTLEFSKLKSIEFKADQSLVVTVPSGATANVTRSNEDGAGFEGYSGICESGPFFIVPERVKRIVFTPPEPTNKQ